MAAPEQVVSPSIDGGFQAIEGAKLVEKQSVLGGSSETLLQAVEVTTGVPIQGIPSGGKKDGEVPVEKEVPTVKTHERERDLEITEQPFAASANLNEVSGSQSFEGVETKGKAWSSVVRGSQALQKYEMNAEDVDGVKVFRVPEAILCEAPLWEDCILGKFLSKAPHVGTIHMTANRIWALGDKSIKIDVFVVNDTTVKFRINNGGVRSRVLRRGMWNIKNIPMLVSKWSPVEEEAQPEMTTIPLWVILKNVPRKMYNWQGLSYLVSPFGEPKRLHPDTLWCKSFEEARVFVEVDLSKALPSSHIFELAKGQHVEVLYEFPWLPPRCSVCSRWGHVNMECQQKSISKEILKKGEKMVESNLTEKAAANRALETCGNGPQTDNSYATPNKKFGNSAGEPSVTVEKAFSTIKNSVHNKSDNTQERQEIVEQCTNVFSKITNSDEIPVTTVKTKWSSPQKPVRKLQSTVVPPVDFVSASPFSVLSDATEEDEDDDEGLDEEVTLEPDQKVVESSEAKKGATIAENGSVLILEGGRISLPRGSKSSHKFLAGPISSPSSTNKSSKGAGKKKKKNQHNH